MDNDQIIMFNGEDQIPETTTFPLFWAVVVLN